MSPWWHNDHRYPGKAKQSTWLNRFICLVVNIWLFVHYPSTIPISLTCCTILNVRPWKFLMKPIEDLAKIWSELKILCLWYHEKFVGRLNKVDLVYSYFVTKVGTNIVCIINVHHCYEEVKTYHICTSRKCAS